MDSSAVLTIGQEGLLILLTVVAPLLGSVLAVGFLISIFQAITQINESTLSFLPKLVTAVAVFAWAGPWMLSTLVNYLQRTIQAIPQMVF